MIVLRGGVGTATKGDESCTGCDRAGAFHRITACARLACGYKLIKLLFVEFSMFFPRPQ